MAQALKGPISLCPLLLELAHNPTGQSCSIPKLSDHEVFRATLCDNPSSSALESKKLILPSEHMAPLVTFLLPSWSVCRGRHYARMLLSLLAWPAALLFLRPPYTLPSWLPIVSGLLPLGLRLWLIQGSQMTSPELYFSFLSCKQTVLIASTKPTSQAKECCKNPQGGFLLGQRHVSIPELWLRGRETFSLARLE